MRSSSPTSRRLGDRRGDVARRGGAGPGDPGEAGLRPGGRHRGGRCLAGPAHQGRRRLEELAAHQRQLRPDALLPRRAHHRRERRAAAAGLRVPDRGGRVDGNRADRGQRRHVPHDRVQPRVCDRRRHRQGVLALQAQDGADHHLLLRPEQPRRRHLGRPGVHGHARREARRARRDERQAGVGNADRRSGEGLQRDHGAERDRQQGPDRHQRRRVRHPRLPQGLRRG